MSGPPSQSPELTGYSLQGTRWWPGWGWGLRAEGCGGLKRPEGGSWGPEQRLSEVRFGVGEGQDWPWPSHLDTQTAWVRRAVGAQELRAEGGDRDITSGEDRERALTAVAWAGSPRGVTSIERGARDPGAAPGRPWLELPAPGARCSCPLVPPNHTLTCALRAAGGL